MKENCILLIAHVTNKNHAIILQKCIESIREYSPEYPILLCTTGDYSLIQDKLSLVDHHIVTTINTLTKIDSPLFVYHSTSEWRMTRTIPAPRYCYGFAQMQKTALALQAAMTLGYKHFLVMNYDTLILESGFIDYMFSEKSSIFFNFSGFPVRMSADVFKLDMETAKLVMTMADLDTYNLIATKNDGNILEDTLGEMLNQHKVNYRKFNASSSSMFQISPFKVIVNNSFNEGAMAAVLDNVIYLLVTNRHPRYTLDGKIEIGYNNNFTTYDVSTSTSILHPITEYTGNDVEIVVRTSFGEIPVVITKDILENSRIYRS
jgi:hypothetical protein